MTIAYPDDDLLGPIEPPKPKPTAPVPGPAPKVDIKLPVSALGCLEIGGLFAIVVAITVGATAWWLGGRGDGPTPTPASAIDPRFVPVGKAYIKDLGVAWGASLEDGAKILDAGQPIGMADDAVAKAWEANRKSAFNAHVTPELSKVVEQGKDEKSVTPADRSALAKAYRGLAKGASNK